MLGYVAEVLGRFRSLSVSSLGLVDSGFMEQGAHCLH